MTAQLPPIALLAGGLATRLRPITEKIPKALVDIAGEPFISHQLRRLKEQGLDRAVLCLGYLGEQVEEFVGRGDQFGLSVTYSYDGDKLLGTGGAIRKALPLLDDVFYVSYADTFLDVSYRDVYQVFLDNPENKGLLTVYRNQNQWGLSNVLFQEGQLLAHSKRRPISEMQHIDYGLSLFKKIAFKEWLGTINIQDSPELNDAFTFLIERGEMLGYEVEKRFYEIGTPERLDETIAFLRSRPSIG